MHSVRFQGRDDRYPKRPDRQPGSELVVSNTIRVEGQIDGRLTRSMPVVAAVCREMSSTNQV